MMQDAGEPQSASERRWMAIQCAVWGGALVLLFSAAWGAAWVVANLRVSLDMPTPVKTAQSDTLPSYIAPPSDPTPAPAPYMSDEGRAITNPAWLEAPQPAFPRAAQRAGEEIGMARLECRTAADGHVRACRIAEEAPAGVGFGEQALKATLKARVRPRLEDGQPTESQIAFTIRYRLD